MRDYIKRLNANIQKGARLELGPKTLIIGDNGAGKDTIIRGIELALLGRASDIAGKPDVGQDHVLAQLAPNRLGVFGADLETAQGLTASWTAKVNETGSVSDTKHVGLPSAIFPLRDLRAKLAQSTDDSRRQFFLEHIAKGLNWADVVKLAPTSAVELLNKTAADVRVLENITDTAQVLQAVKKQANSLKLSKSKEAKAAKALVDSLAATSDTPHSKSDIEAAVQDAYAQHAKAQAMRQAYVTAVAELKAAAATSGQVDRMRLQMQHHGLMTALQGAQDRLTAAQATRDKCVAEVTSLQNSLQQAPPGLSVADRQALAQTEALYRSLVAVVEQQALQAGQGTLSCCVACGQGVNAQAAQQFATQAKANAEAYLQQLAAYASDTEQRKLWEHKLAEFQHHVAAYHDQVVRAQAEIDGLQGQAHALEAQLSQGFAAPQPADPTEYLRSRGLPLESEVVDQENRAYEANNYASQLEREAAAYEGVAKARDQEAEAQALSHRYKLLVDVCDDLIARLLKRQRDSFVAKVRSYMPKPEKMPQGGEFDLHLTRGTKDICELGLLRGPEGAQTLHTALSGAEGDIVFTAIACALAEGTPLSIIIAADREKTSRTLTEQMRALNKTQAQVILTTTQKPSGLKGLQNKGWTIIELESNRAGDTADLGDGGGAESGAGGVDVLTEGEVDDTASVSRTSAQALGSRDPGMVLEHRSGVGGAGIHGVGMSNSAWASPVLPPDVVGGAKAAQGAVTPGYPTPPAEPLTFQWGPYLWNGHEDTFAKGFESICGMTPREVEAGLCLNGQYRKYDNGTVVYIQGSSWTLYSGSSGIKAEGLAKLAVQAVFEAGQELAGRDLGTDVFLL